MTPLSSVINDIIAITFLEDIGVVVQPTFKSVVTRSTIKRIGPITPNDVIIANNVGWARSGLPAIIFDRVTSGNSYNNVLITDSPSGHAGSRDIMHSGNPGFRNASTDPGSADFRPSGDSVLKGAVRDSPTFVSTDLVGTSRGGGTPDVGAFEAEASSR